MTVCAGFSKVDLMDILPEQRYCEMQICGIGMYLAQENKRSFFFTVDFMDFDLQTVSVLEDSLSTVLPAQTQIHILTTHNHGAGTCSQLDMERFSRYAAECAEKAVCGAAEAKVRFAIGQLDRSITYTRRIFVPEIDGSFTCFYGIDSADKGNASRFVDRALSFLEKDALCFSGNGAAPGGDRTFPAADQTIAAVEFRTPDDRPLGNIIRFASHAICCNLPDHYSSDFPGYLRQAMENKLGGVSLFWNGPCAEIAPLIAEKSPETGRRFADVLAENAAALLEHACFQKLEHFNDTIRRVPLPVRREVLANAVTLPENTSDIQKKKKFLEDQRVKAILPFLTGIYKNGVKSLDDKITVSTALLELDDMNFLFFSGETFSSTANEIISEFPEKNWITVTEHGRTAMYMPPEKEYRRGGYEPTCAVISEDGESELKCQMIAFIKNA